MLSMYYLFFAGFLYINLMLGLLYINSTLLMTFDFINRVSVNLESFKPFALTEGN